MLCISNYYNPYCQNMSFNAVASPSSSSYANLYYLTIIITLAVHLYFICLAINKKGAENKNLIIKSSFLFILGAIFFLCAYCYEYKIADNFIFIAIFSLWLYTYDSFVFDNLSIFDHFPAFLGKHKITAFITRLMIFGLILVVYQNFSIAVHPYSYDFPVDNQLIMTMFLVNAAAGVIIALYYTVCKLIDLNERSMALWLLGALVALGISSGFLIADNFDSLCSRCGVMVINFISIFMVLGICVLYAPKSDSTL
ncbi:MAG: hypothetical protein KA049_01335 [Burkholderiales bacterium]|nr:hypothetical protein [Burkholderiales bacterium]MBP9768143.1 hypothetical protein [Burkholderiales bacterium]